MRDIKFRAWDGKKMKKSCFKVHPDGQLECLPSIDCIGFEPVLMQFTGLTDANGVEIYEGDIVECNLVTDKGVIEDHIGKVFFEDFEYVVETQDNLWPVASWKCVSRCEVIGNIHQHPELLINP